jgi:hypothetical protein
MKKLYIQNKYNEDHMWNSNEIRIRKGTNQGPKFWQEGVHIKFITPFPNPRNG